MKRTREPDWVVQFEDATSLRMIVDVASNTSSRVTFVIAKNEKTGRMQLQVDGQTPAKTCVMVARLQLDDVKIFNQDFKDEFEFHVDVKQLMVALDGSMSAQYAVKIEGYGDDATIVVELYDPDTDSHKERIELRTYVSDPNQMQMENYDVDINLEVDLAKLKDMIKKARKISADHIRITIYLNGTSSRDEQSTTIYSIEGSDCILKQIFSHPTTRDEDDSLIVRASTDHVEKLEETNTTTPKYDGIFAIQELEGFLKSISTRMLDMKLKTDMPMMMLHNLGGLTEDESYIRYMIAPTCAEA